MAIRILGIHDGHNASAALLVDGKIVHAVQEERLTRVKNQAGLPVLAIREILGQTGYQMADIDFFALDGHYMVHYDDYARALLAIYGTEAFVGGKIRKRFREILRESPFFDGFYRRLRQHQRLQRLAKIGVDLSKVIAVEHHVSHAAAAYYGFGRMDGDTLVLTCDARGDRICGSVSIGHGGRLDRIAAIPEDDSLGRLYSYVTYLLGMMPLEHEYKVMGLAPYAEESDRNVQRLRKKFASLFVVDQARPLEWRRSPGVPSLFSADSLIEALVRRERFDWVAAGLQLALEDILCQWVRNCIRETGVRQVALSGGVFMNVKVNKRILELDEVDDMFIFPSCGDETSSIGAAYFVYANHCSSAQAVVDPLSDLYWGRSFSDSEVERELAGFPFRSQVEWSFDDNIEHSIAQTIASGMIVARAKGRMEFGARALGNRSILADPSDTRVVKVINDMIKMRDFWMPFAPSVLAERAFEYYVKAKPVSAPYMILAFDSRPEKMPLYPAAVHPYDYTTRPQEVHVDSNPEYYRLIKEYESIKGEAIILNTSFNLHGDPIVYRPIDALEVFDRSGLRHMALGNFLIHKVTKDDK